MRVIYPRSDEARITLLNQIVSLANHELGAGTEHLPAPLLATVQTLESDFQALFAQKLALWDVRSAKMAQRDKALRMLELSLVMGRSVVLAEAQLHEYPAIYSQIYDAHLPLPRYLSPRQLLTKGEAFMKADAQAVVEGYPTLPYPTMADFERRWQMAHQKHNDADTADLRLDELQHRLQGKREEVNEVLRMVNAQLNLRWFSLPADDVNHIKERFGFKLQTNRPSADSGDKGTASTGGD